MDLWAVTDRSDDGARTGLVLGGGGVLGAAWMIGALRALCDALGWDARSADMIVGTSAGAVLAAMLGSGVHPRDLYDHQKGVELDSGPLVGYEFDLDTATGGSMPPRPRLGIGSRSLLVRSVRHPRRYPRSALISAFVPAGRGSLDSVGRLVDDLVPEGGWSPHPGVRAVAMDYDTGERVAFGGPAAPPVGLAQAVVASCSIPGWFPPAVIDGRRFVDGGIWSATNVDLMAPSHLPGPALDDVWVLAPAASRDFDRPSALVHRVERRVRHAYTRRMLTEAREVRGAGTRVHILCPGPEILRLFGGNLMDPAHRLEIMEIARQATTAELRATVRSAAA
jgi:NTE family protein